MSRALQRRGFTVIEALNGDEALKAVGQSDCSAAVIDLRMPGMGGLELLQRLREQYSALPAIVLTGHGSISTAIDAIRLGAFHYLTKPCDISELEIYLRKAIERHHIQRENERLRGDVERSRNSCGITGQSGDIQTVLDLIERMKDSDAPVLVTGESGTGKELVAQALHNRSQRNGQPFIAVNCATLKPELLENELFGHVAGAFTGAIKRKEGLLAIANGGSLFIDEIVDMDPNVQASLLRVIETGEFRPLGSTKVRTTSTRIIAAANRDLSGQVKAGIFRQDLYYRLNVLVIHTPPLRNHTEDIPLLVETFLQRSDAVHKGITFSPDAFQVLQSYPWAGNVRELFNVCERAVLLRDGNVISSDAIRALLSMDSPPLTQKRSNPILQSLDQAEKTHIQAILNHTEGNISQTADILQIDRRTLQRKMIKYGLREE